MRMIGSLDDEQQLQRFKDYLEHKHIAYQVEFFQNAYEIWILDEEKVHEAVEALARLKEKPDQPDFAAFERKLEPKKENEHKGEMEVASSLTSKQKMPLTWSFICICIGIYIITIFSLPFSQKITGLFLYEMPKGLSYELKYQTLQHEEKKDSQQMQTLRKAIRDNPYWKGIESLLLDKPDTLSTPSFTQIREGEVWRLITPIFLHGSILHILFNMLWLFLLGRALEMNLAKFSYLVLVVLAALISNTCQYLASGPLFLGFSGVIAAMAGWILGRRKKAPWEIYLVDPSAIKFLLYFIFVLMGISIVLFVLSLYNRSLILLPIANTGHVSGLIFGYLWAKILR